MYANGEEKISLNERAYRKINESIISLRLSPGSLVDERILAENMGIGRTPIREALFRLAAEGLVETVPKRGFFIKPVTADDIRALFEAMIFLERDAVFLAARRITKERIGILKGVHEVLQRAMESRDYLQVTLENSRFHRLIYDAVGNGFLKSSLYNLQNQAQRLAYLSYSRDLEPDNLEAHFQRVLGDHTSIIELFAAGDRKGLVQKITEHVQLFHSRVLRYISPPLEEIEVLDPSGGMVVDG